MLAWLTLLGVLLLIGMSMNEQAAIARLTASVAAERTISASVVTLLAGVAEQIRNLDPDDSDAINALADSIDSSSNDIADAVRNFPTGSVPESDTDGISAIGEGEAAAGESQAGGEASAGTTSGAESSSSDTTGESESEVQSGDVTGETGGAGNETVQDSTGTEGGEDTVTGDSEFGVADSESGAESEVAGEPAAGEEAPASESTDEETPPTT